MKNNSRKFVYPRAIGPEMILDIYFTMRETF